MRVTERMRWLKTQRQMTQTASKADEASERALTGKRVTSSSDDPAAYLASQRLTRQTARLEAFMDNANHVEMELNRMDSVMNIAHNLLSRAVELTVQFGDSSYNADEMIVASEEVKTMRQSMINLANTKHMDRALFGGTQSQGDIVNEVTGAYKTQNIEHRSVTIGEAGLQITLQTAEEVFGPQGQTAFDALANFVTALETADDNAILASQDELRDSLDRIEASYQRVGHDTNRTIEAIEFGEGMNFLNHTQNTAITEADFVEAVSSMEQSSTIYELSIKIASEQKQLTRSIMNL